MSVFGTSINDSPTVVVKAAAALAAAPAYKAISAGGAVAGAGAHAIGIAIPMNDEPVQSGGDIHVQIKDVGAWKAGTIASGSEIAAGDELASDANGYAVKATSGAFIIGVALEAATATGQIIPVHIRMAGYK